MSEDEACRRIELARLARRFPALYAELASGQITLSVALVLKPALSPSNHLELLAAARGKCIRQVRELVAERFPKPDLPSSIRKLPERRPMQARDPEQARSPAPPPVSCAALPSLAATAPASPSSVANLAVPVTAVREPTLELSALILSSPPVEEQTRPAAPRAGSPSPASRDVIEPLSAQRYRIQFTADALLKQQLELARNLLRHAHPSGDFGPIVSRALKLLIDDLLRSRFGARARRSSPSAAASPTPTPTSARAPASAVSSSTPAAQANADPSRSEQDSNAPARQRPGPACSPTTVTPTTPTRRSSYVPRAARRAVLEHDGLRCSWTDAHGARCSSQAWLELDHRHPAGKGGGSESENLRMLCRAHNRLAAEHAYGRPHIERATTHRRHAHRVPRPPA